MGCDNLDILVTLIPKTFYLIPLFTLIEYGYHDAEVSGCHFFVQMIWFGSISLRKIIWSYFIRENSIIHPKKYFNIDTRQSSYTHSMHTNAYIYCSPGISDPLPSQTFFKEWLKAPFIKSLRKNFIIDHSLTLYQSFHQNFILHHKPLLILMPTHISKPIFITMVIHGLTHKPPIGTLFLA